MKSVKDNVEGKNLITEERSFDNFNSLLLDNVVWKTLLSLIK